MQLNIQIKRRQRKRESRGSQKKHLSAPFFSTLVSQFFDRGFYFASARSHRIGRLHDTLIVQLEPPALACQRHGERSSDGCRDSAIRVRPEASALPVEVVFARPLKLLEAFGSYLSCHEDMIVSQGRSALECCCIFRQALPHLLRMVVKAAVEVVTASRSL